jgi:hypothetical protein
MAPEGTNSNHPEADDMALELVDQPEGGKIAVNGPKATVTVQDDCATGN